MTNNLNEKKSADLLPCPNIRITVCSGEIYVSWVWENAAT